MKAIFYPYKMGSKSCRDLARQINGLRVYPDRYFKPKRRHLIINWGNTQLPNWWNRALRRYCTILNHPDSVKNSSCKIRMLNELTRNGVESLEYTTNRDIAQEWLDDGKRVVVRHSTSGHGGSGIEIFNTGTLPYAPLYTIYKRKQQEFRVHIFKDCIIDFTEKRRRGNWESLDNFNKYVRNFENGWVFCREEITLSQDAKELAIESVKSLGLDFGAVDLGIDSNGNSFIIEVNSAPGIEGTTLRKYVNFFKGLL